MKLWLLCHWWTKGPGLEIASYLLDFLSSHFCLLISRILLRPFCFSLVARSSRNFSLFVFIMPFEQPDSADATSTNLLKRNPFLIFRLVSLGMWYRVLHIGFWHLKESRTLLALLSNLALLSLIFASWNVNASLSARLSGIRFSTLSLYGTQMSLFVQFHLPRCLSCSRAVSFWFSWPCKRSCS